MKSRAAWGGTLQTLTIISLAASTTLEVQAQSPQTNDSRYTITERGPDHRVWQRVASETNALTRQVTQRTNRYTEVASGLNYLDESGQWVESQDSVELTPDGGAAAVRGPTKIHFNANLNTRAAITLTTRSNRVFQTHPMCLAYYDASSGKSVVLSRIKDCVGELLPPNQSVYKSAFDSLEADVRYTYTKAAFESDVILLEQPPAPESFGLNPATTRLEVWHEWLNAPSPRVTRRVLARESNAEVRDRMVEPDFTDQIADFGDAWFPTGAAYVFDVSTARGTNVPARVRVPNLSREPGLAAVAKTWLVVSNRTFLIESIRWPDLQPKIQGLPVSQRVSITAPQERTLCLSQLPAPNGPGENAVMDVARDEYRPTGVVLDYITVSGSDDYTFASGNTYYVGSGYFQGTVTFNGGAVVKYADGGGLICYGSFVFNSSGGNPAILTSVDDDQFGDTITNSTHCPSYAANAAVWYYFGPNPVSITGLIIRWAQTAVQFDESGDPCSGLTHSVSTSTIEYSQTGIYANNCTVNVDYSYQRTVETPTAIAPWAEDCTSFSGSLTATGTGDDDGDGMPDSWEIAHFGNLCRNGSGDYDGDGLSDLAEYTAGTNPTLADTDGDGMPDAWEVANGLNPLLNDASDDPDGDWITNINEYHGGTNSTNPRDVMVVAWGDNSDGQCNVPENLREVVAVAGGFDFSLALRKDGTIVPWGANTYGQTTIPAGLTNATMLSARWWDGAALKLDGTMNRWGASSWPVPSWATNLSRVAVGYDYVLGLQSNGTVLAWGQPSYRTNLIAGLTNITEIAASTDHKVALRNNGSVVAWGLTYDFAGWNLTNVPASATNVISISAGEFHTLALKTNGTVVAWGAGTVFDPTNSYLGADLGQSITPTGLSNVVAIAAGDYRSLALRADGTVVGWGDNLFGQGTAPPGVSNLTAIAAGPFHTLAIRNGRQLPIILTQPVNQAAPAGSNVTFSASGLGLAGVHYQWQLNGTNIAGATNATLTLTNVQTSNNGNYQVVVSTGAGSNTSSTAIFELITPPVLVSQTQPDRQWAPLSPPLVFSVGITASAQWSSPLSYQWNLNGTPIQANGTGSNYTVFQFATNEERHYSCTITNAAGVTNSQTWKVRTLNEGGIAAWGSDAQGQLDWPANATNVIAVAAGGSHSLAVREDGSVIAWGLNDSGQTNAPALTDAIAVAAGNNHSLALRDNGTVVAWGRNNETQTNVPSGLTNVMAIAAGGQQSFALSRDGTVMRWGAQLGSGLAGISNVTAIAAGTNFFLALRNDGTLAALGDTGSPTNVPSAATNVVAIAAGDSHALALKENGTIVAWGLNTSGQTNVPAGLSNVMAVAAGRAHSVALINDGTVVCWGDNSNGQTNVGAGLKWIKSIAAGGDHTLAAVFSSFVQYQVDVSKDLLLIYNSASSNSIWVKDYYLAQRPMVSGANALGIACSTDESITPSTFTNQILEPYLDWLNQNPTKRPQYVIAFLDIPSRVHEGTNIYDSVFYQLSSKTPGLSPFVMAINMNGTNDCRAYIDKLRFFGTNYSPGKLIISASGGGYSNTNYVVDNVRNGFGHVDNYTTSPEKGRDATNGLISAGVSSSAIQYAEGLETVTNQVAYNLAHITNALNLAGYFSWGFHSSLGSLGSPQLAFSTNGTVVWSSASSWFIMETVESGNGQRNTDFGGFFHWFSPNAFGGTNHFNTPVGAVTHVDEPQLYGVNNTYTYFNFWASGKSFGIAAWNSRQTERFQAVGDPLLRR